MQMKKIILSAFSLFGFVGGAYATDIQLMWNQPTLLEDGSALEKVDGYRVYYSIDNTAQANIEVSATSTDYVLADVQEGSHTFQIATIANGVESNPSDPVNVDVERSKPVKIELTVKVVE